MYEFIVDMIVWGDCELTLTILVDLERNTNAKKTIQHSIQTLYRRCCCYFDLISFFCKATIILNTLSFFFLRSYDYFEYLKFYFCKTVLFRILNYLIIIDL